MIDLIELIEVQHEGKTFLLSKFPAVAGREIVSKYPLSGMPKLGDYKTNEETMLKLMSFVAIKLKDGIVLHLDSRDLIDNHIKSWETLARLEIEMLEYNVSFFQNGRISNFLTDIAPKLQAWISKTLTDSLAQLSQTEKQPSTN